MNLKYLLKRPTDVTIRKESLIYTDDLLIRHILNSLKIGWWERHC